jgi:hypothetical protein
MSTFDRRTIPRENKLPEIPTIEWPRNCRNNWGSTPVNFEETMVKAKNWSSFLSEESKARENSPLKALANYLTTPGLISLGGGYPPTRQV